MSKMDPWALAASTSSTEYYGEMLKQLRVCDLQQVLDYIGRSRTGVRAELINRCMDALMDEKKCVAARFKVTEVFDTRKAQRSNRAPPKIVPTAVGNGLTSIQVTASAPARCTSSSSVHRVYAHIQFENICFFELYAQLCSPVSLSSTAYNPVKTDVVYRTACTFSLTAQQSQQISFHQELIGFTPATEVPARLKRAEYEVVLRFCKIPKSCSTQTSKPSSKPDAEVNRPGRPIVITPQCRLGCIPNRLDISWSVPQKLESSHTGQYAMSIFIYKRLSVETLIARMSDRTCIDRVQSMEIIKKKLDPKTNSDVLSDSLKASLKCPLSRSFIRIPVRSANCKHVQCFDLEMYLRMNEKRPTWQCPVCDEKVLYPELQIDAFFGEILSDFPNKVAPNVDADTTHEVVFDQNAGWKLVYEAAAAATEANSSPTLDEAAAFVPTSDVANNKTNSAPPTIVVIDSDEHDDDDDDGDNRDSHNVCTNLNQHPPLKRSKPLLHTQPFAFPTLYNSPRFFDASMPLWPQQMQLQQQQQQRVRTKAPEKSNTEPEIITLD